MVNNVTRLVYVEKDGDLRTHLAKESPVQWSSGRTSTEWVPACGSRVDVTALYSYTGAANEATCGRCTR